MARKKPCIQIFARNLKAGVETITQYPLSTLSKTLTVKEVFENCERMKFGVSLGIRFVFGETEAEEHFSRNIQHLRRGKA